MKIDICFIFGIIFILLIGASNHIVAAPEDEVGVNVHDSFVMELTEFRDVRVEKLTAPGLNFRIPGSGFDTVRYGEGSRITYRISEFEDDLNDRDYDSVLLKHSAVSVASSSFRSIL